MKRLLTFLTVLFATLTAFAQGDSPYARFGYEGKILRTPQERQQRMMLVIPNPDTAATVAQIGLDPAKQHYYLFDKQNQVLASDTLPSTTVSKFLSVDPLSAKYAWYTPYQFAGNKPIQFVDIDGLEEGFDIRSRQMEMGYLKGTVSEKELREFQETNGRIGIMGLTGLFDAFVTKGWLTRAYIAYTLGDAIDNGEQSLKAKITNNPAAAAYYSNQSRNSYIQFGVGVGLVRLERIVSGVLSRMAVSKSRLDMSKFLIPDDQIYWGPDARAYAYYDNKQFGFFRYNQMDKGLEISLNIPKELQDKGIGSAFFEAVMTDFEPTKFTGTWVKSDIYEGGISTNLAQYQAGLDKGLSSKAAAFDTWSGRQAFKHGFKNVTVTPIDGGVQATFTK